MKNRSPESDVDESGQAEPVAETAERRVIEATVATTHVVEKYGTERLALSALEQMRSSLLKGDVPLRFNHDGRKPLDAQILDVEIRTLEDGEQAVVATVSVAVSHWAYVEAQFGAAGVRGGISYTRHEFENVVGPTPAIERHEPPAIVIAADAAAFSPEDRADAALAIAVNVQAVVEIRRSYSYSAHELAQVLIEAGPSIAWSVVASAVWEGVKALFWRKSQSTRIEVTRKDDQLRWIVETSDPEVVRAALEQLPRAAQLGAESPAVFDGDAMEWDWPGRDGNAGSMPNGK